MALSTEKKATIKGVLIGIIGAIAADYTGLAGTVIDFLLQFF